MVISGSRFAEVFSPSKLAKKSGLTWRETFLKNKVNPHRNK